MTVDEVLIKVSSNNKNIEKIFDYYGKNNLPKITSYPPKNHFKYHIHVIDLQSEISEASQNLIQIYSSNQIEKVKLAVVLLHGLDIDKEKNQYFIQLLSEIGGDSPIHRVHIVRDLYTKNFEEDVFWLNKYIRTSINSRKITISKKGNYEYYPFSFEDFIQAIQKSLFLNNTQGQVFWLGGEPIKEIDIAYTLSTFSSSNNGDTNQFSIESTNYSSAEDVEFLSNCIQTKAKINWQTGDYFLEDLKKISIKYLEEGVETFSQIHTIHNKSTLLDKIKSFGINFRNKLTTKKGIQNKIKDWKSISLRSIEVVILVFVAILSLNTLIFISSTSISFGYLQKSVNHLKEGDIKNSVNSLNSANRFYTIADKSYSYLDLYVSTLLPDTHRKNHNIITFQKYSISSIQSLQQTYQLSERIFNSLVDKNQRIEVADISLALKTNLSKAYEDLGQIELLSVDDFPSFFNSKIKNSPEIKSIKEMELQISQVLKISDLLPLVINNNGSKNVVFVFQNSHERRSLGGSVNFVVNFSIDSGTIISNQIYTSKDIDDKVTEQVPAPALVEHFTGLNNWKFRDVNFNPDVTKTGENVIWFLQNTIKTKPDVVVFLSDRTVSLLLDETGGIEVDGENINSSTLSKILLQSGNESAYQKVVAELIQSVLSKKIKTYSLGSSVAKAISENQVVLWTTDTQTEKNIEDQSFSGSITQRNCHSSLSQSRVCLSQSSFLNISNFSMIPLNSILNQQILHKVNLTGNKVEHEYQVTYKYESEVPNLNRDLLEVYQLYIPINSVLGDISIDGEIRYISNIQRQNEKLLERIQIPITTSINSEHLISIKYITPLSEVLKLPIAYSLTEYSQTGTKNEGVTVEIHYPSNARPAAITAPASAGPGYINYKFPHKTATFGINFVPN